MWIISLLFLLLSSVQLAAMPYGIQPNPSDAHQALDYLTDTLHCKPCYEDPYEKPTSSENILSCAGPILFVGAAYTPFIGETRVYLGAFALAQEVHKITVLNTPHESNGVYWYFTPGKSFGFLGDNDLQQDASEDTGTTNPGSRLSWTLNTYGGYRAGTRTDLSGETGYWGQFWKMIFNCPLNI